MAYDIDPSRYKGCLQSICKHCGLEIYQPIDTTIWNHKKGMGYDGWGYSNCGYANDDFYKFKNLNAEPLKIQEIKTKSKHICECKHCNRIMNDSLSISVQIEPVGRKFKNPAFSS